MYACEHGSGADEWVDVEAQTTTNMAGRALGQRHPDGNLRRTSDFSWRLILCAIDPCRKAGLTKQARLRIYPSWRAMALLILGSIMPVLEKIECPFLFRGIGRVVIGC